MTTSYDRERYSHFSDVRDTNSGWRPPNDPDDWDQLYFVDTRKHCSNCETALTFVIESPVENVVSAVEMMMEEYYVQFSEGWAGDYENPAYIYCENPVCTWHSVVEWTDLRSVYEEWLSGEALNWEERCQEQMTETDMDAFESRLDVVSDAFDASEFPEKDLKRCVKSEGETLEYEWMCRFVGKNGLVEFPVPIQATSVYKDGSFVGMDLQVVPGELVESPSILEEGEA